MDLKPGTRLYSTVCSGQVIVVRPPATEIDIACGDEPMTPEESAGSASDAAATDLGPKLGKRYVDAESGLELLCVREGHGGLTAGDRTLPEKPASPLPSSD